VTYLRRFALAISIAIVYVTVLWAAIRMHERNSTVSPPSIAPAPSASARIPFVLTPPPDFDFEKKDRQIEWCYAHHGVPAMAFTHDRSNVLCLKPAAVIELPKDQ
jgi:hypothetical protein